MHEVHIACWQAMCLAGQALIAKQVSDTGNLQERTAMCVHQQLPQRGGRSRDAGSNRMHGDGGVSAALHAIAYKVLSGCALPRQYMRLNPTLPPTHPSSTYNRRCGPQQDCTTSRPHMR